MGPEHETASLSAIIKIWPDGNWQFRWEEWGLETSQFSIYTKTARHKNTIDQNSSTFQRNFTLYTISNFYTIHSWERNSFLLPARSLSLFLSLSPFLIVLTVQRQSPFHRSRTILILYPLHYHDFVRQFLVLFAIPESLIHYLQYLPDAFRQNPNLSLLN